MITRQESAGNALRSGSGLIALLLAAWCSPSLAATGVDVECPETGHKLALVTIDIALPELAIPSLAIDGADHGIDGAAAIKEEIVAQPATIPAVSATGDDEVTEVEEAEAAATETAPAATRLPGISAKDQPRYRRQMYRTDI